MYSRNFTPERIITLAPNEVFVFGSNLRGQHEGGAARIAYENFGAEWGQGSGLYGQSYAIPTMLGNVARIGVFVDGFIEFAKEHQTLIFYVTRIGCGIAGFDDSQIAPLFKAALDVENIILPESFVRILEFDAKMPKAARDMLYGQTRTLVDILKEMNRKRTITDLEDAMTRLTEFLEMNQRYGDEVAFMAQRTIWCLLSRYMQEGLPFDLDRLEKDMYQYHDDNPIWADSVQEVYYRYCVAKIIRYVSFLNTFRRYRNYEEIDHDIHTVDNNHCGENPRDYFFSMSRHVVNQFIWGFQDNAEEIFREGRLDEEALEKVFFKNHQDLLDALGLERMIEEQYGMVGCHADIQAPMGSLVGPVYRDRGAGRYEVSCFGTYRPFLGQTWFEMSKAKELLDADARYMSVRHGYDLVYIPINDFSLPVFSERDGIMHFEYDSAKRRFIELLRSHGSGC